MIPTEEIVMQKHLPNRKVVYVVRDDCPSDFYGLEDETVEIIFWTRDYNLGQKDNYGSAQHFFECIGAWDDDENDVNVDAVIAYANSGAVLIPVVYLDLRYDCTLQVRNLDEAFIEAVSVDHHGPFDRRAYGFAHISKEKVEKEFTHPEYAVSTATDMIQLYENYLNGLVFGFIVEQTVEAHYTNPETLETETFDHVITVDSCWGFDVLSSQYPDIQKELEGLIDENLEPEAKDHVWVWN